MYNISSFIFSQVKSHFKCVGSLINNFVSSSELWEEDQFRRSIKGSVWNFFNLYSWTVDLIDGYLALFDHTTPKLKTHGCFSNPHSSK